MIGRTPLNISLINYLPISILGISPIPICSDVSGNRIAFAGFTSSIVYILNATTFAVLATVTGFSSPGAIGFDATNNAFWVGNDTTSAISIIDGSTYGVTHNVIVSATLSSMRDIKIDNAGNRVFITSFGTNKVYIYNLTTYAAITNFAISGCVGLVLDLPNNKIYTSSYSGNSIIVNNATTYAAISTITGSGAFALNSPYGIADDPVNTDWLIITNLTGAKLSAYSKTAGAITKQMAGFTSARNSVVINSKIYTTQSSISKICYADQFYL